MIAASFEKNPMKQTVGFIGLGIMGRPTAKNLLRAGFLLWSIAAAGGRWRS